MMRLQFVFLSNIQIFEIMNVPDEDDYKLISQVHGYCWLFLKFNSTIFEVSNNGPYYGTSEDECLLLMWFY